MRFHPDNVVWCDGSDRERERLTRRLVDPGTLIPQQTEPRSFRCALDPDDVAQVGRHTDVCTRDAAAVDPASNWMEPLDIRIILTEEYRGCMSGRTMYVVPFYLETSTDGGRATPCQSSSTAVLTMGTQCDPRRWRNHARRRSVSRMPENCS